MDIETQFPVRMHQVVEWGDVDSFGHVNNCKYFRYYENVRLVYFEAIGLFTSVKDDSVQECGPILARISNDFKLPLFFPDRVRIDCGMRRIGRSSFNLAYRIFSETQQTIVAEADSVVVYYNYHQKVSRPLTEALLSRIRQLEGVPSMIPPTAPPRGGP